METSWQLYVDPVCPYAWIASRWLQEVTTVRPFGYELRLMSLAVLNEGRQLEAWYRAFNDSSWSPARVAAAVEHAGAFERYYEAFGRRVHLDGRKDWDAVVLEALDECGLPRSMAAAALTDPATEDTLRQRHDTLNRLVGLETGTPTLVIGDMAVFGPVLRAVPRGAAAVALLDATNALTKVPAFTQIRRGDDRPLDRR